MEHLNKWLSPQQVEDKYNISKPTLYNWRVQKKNLPFSKFGNFIKYNSQDIEAFLLSQLVEVEK